MNFYVQRTGNFYEDDTLLWKGYAGNGAGLNNPEMQNVHRVGPLPCGLYEITRPYKHPILGPCTMNLVPNDANEMFGRYGFRIHGDNSAANHSASKGCIVHSPAADRQKVWDSDDHMLTVVAEESDLKRKSHAFPVVD